MNIFQSKLLDFFHSIEDKIVNCLYYCEGELEGELKDKFCIDDNDKPISYFWTFMMNYFLIPVYIRLGKLLTKLGSPAYVINIDKDGYILN